MQELSLLASCAGFALGAGLAAVITLLRFVKQSFVFSVESAFD